jgi:hypothetical protein
MRRTGNILVASAIVLAGCASIVLIALATPTPTRALGPAVQTLHVEAVPLAASEVQIASAPGPASGSLPVTRMVTGMAVEAPAPAISATAEQPQRAIGQARCPANPHSGLPCVSR